MSMEGQYTMQHHQQQHQQSQQQQGMWMSGSCAQPDWQNAYPQASPPNIGSPDHAWGTYGSPQGLTCSTTYHGELPRVPPMYHPNVNTDQSGYGQQLPHPQEGYTWGKNLLDASNYMQHFGNHASTVARRNERERNRVRHINSTFENLRHHLPCSIKKKKLSKVDTLRTAIKYINHLQNILGKDIKPLAQQIKKERQGGDADAATSPTSPHPSSKSMQQSSSTSSTTSSSHKRQSLDSSTTSTSSGEHMITEEVGEQRREEDEQDDEDDDEETSCSHLSQTASALFSTEAHFQWPSS